MNDFDTAVLDSFMEDIRGLIAKKDTEIREHKAVIESLQHQKEKEYEHGIEVGIHKGTVDGLYKAWELAKKIVHLEWDGRFAGVNTVEEWFEKYTPVEALDAMENYEKKKDSDEPHWIIDYERNRFRCTKCGTDCREATPYCPWCGTKIVDVEAKE